MESISKIIDAISTMFQWWFIVTPWEKAVRVRGGKKVKVVGEGIYFKIPFFDSVYIQNTKVRVVDLPVQTITTLDKQTLTISSIVGYSIDDILTLYNTLYHPDSTIANIVMGRISEYISTHNLDECSPQKVESAMKRELNKTEFGISYKYVRVVSHAVVRTYRLIGDGGLYDELDMDLKK